MSAQLSWQFDNDALAFTGELTRATVAGAWRERAQWLGEQNPLVVSLANVERVDSAGVAMLLQLKKYLLQQQCELVIHQPSQQFKAIVDVSGAATLLDVQ
ncbi:STAS domain-containing protein [Pseudidiomarina sediminum]|uniref:STAS domain-containing protein n=1 Tax=Pseudidiomarina sediminum TaxID=431675 RepID=UPI001C95CA8A|nr:STAS domain-containing protein [Pseudidiomarina sediminum]MBY6063908.1 STAS domain-containing protein [Pseudidiomarina sediminum]